MHAAVWQEHFRDMTEQNILHLPYDADYTHSHHQLLAAHVGSRG